MAGSVCWQMLAALTLFGCAADGEARSGDEPYALAFATEPAADTGRAGDLHMQLDPAAAPLPGKRDEWTFTEIAGAVCRDGSPTGVAINRGSGKGLMIYLEGGGWCVDEQSCLINPANHNHPTALVQSWIATLGGGLFDRGNPENPLRDFSFVYVPYCTGDLHAGANPFGNVAGVGPQKFVGYLNLRKFLPRIVATFADANDVLLTGVSAGGLGALYTAPLVQRAFPGLTLSVLSDCGPPLSRALFTECFQDRQRTLFRFDQTVLAECGTGCDSTSDYVQDYLNVLTGQLATGPVGVIESTNDAVILGMVSAFADDCTGSIDFLFPGVSGAALHADLLGLRERLLPFETFSTFYLEGGAHTFIQTDALYGASAGGVRLVDWIRGIVATQQPGHVGP